MELRLRRPFPLSTQLIGVDGGATEVKVHEVCVVEDELGARLELGERAASAVYPRVPGFETPAALGIRKPSDLGHIGPAEREQGWAWIETTAECIARVARERGAKNVLVGIAMPGVKTSDERGIAFALNGPRVAHFLDELERRLASEGLELLAPFTPLLSDGLCCGLGEEYAAGGLFRRHRNAYYVGGGTGVAEALKLRGRLIETDTFEPAFPRAWKLREPFESLSYDAALSAAGINRQYAQRAGLPGDQAEFARPEQHTAADSHARMLFELTGKRLASLVKTRVVALRAFDWDSHKYGSSKLECVVVGQQLGRLFADERTRPWFQRAFREHLVSLLREEYSEEARLVVRASTLRAAPAIGAAASALIAWDRAHG